MNRPLKPARTFGGTIRVPGDKSIGHRSALISLLAREPIQITGFPDGADCLTSLAAVQQLGVRVEKSGSELTLTPPHELRTTERVMIDCGNSGTTARLIAGILAGSPVEVTLTGDESLSRRPMRRVIDPLTQMGAELHATDGHFPVTIRGRKLLPFAYHLKIPSAQVKSSLVLAALASGTELTLKEDALTRDHTELMLGALCDGVTTVHPKSARIPDPNDPRKMIREQEFDYKREVRVAANARVRGGHIDVPGDISTASFFFAVGALAGKPVTVREVSLNPTRTQFLDYLKSAGASVSIADKQTISGELRGTVTVGGGALKGRKVSGELTVGLIDEIPILSVVAAFSEGTTLIRDAAELRVKESDRLAAIGDNLTRMGVKVGVLDDGLIIDGKRECQGADFSSFGDHRIAMAFSIAALFCTGPSTMDDAEAVGISCPTFYELLSQVAR